MAKVRQYVGRGTNDFVMKLFSSNSLESQSKVWTNVTHMSSLSVGILLGDNKNCGLNGAENTANQEIVGVYSRRVKHRPDASLENKIYYCYNRGLEENQYFSKKRMLMTGWKVPKHRIYSKIWSLSSSSGGQQNPCFRPLFRSCERFVFIREFSDNGTRSEPLFKTKTGYYDVLGLSPSATQAQIKTAYYKQSFVYHPDRNAGSDEATVRFSVISEAYTVLGNKGLRKKYDRGLLSPSDFTATTKPVSAKHRDSAGGSATHQAASRRSVAGRDDSVYFEEFYKGHYSKQLEKERQLRAKREEQQRNEEETFEDKKMEVQVQFGMLFIALMAIAILVTIK